jgi:hypothetical protein
MINPYIKEKISLINSGLPFLKLKVEMPFAKMAEEARLLESKFVKHRYGNGWKSLTLYGLGSDKTQHHDEYGYADRPLHLYNWTDIADQCPVTKQWLEQFPCGQYHRVRFMWLEPKSRIPEHADGGISGLCNINVALDHPEDCNMVLDGKVIPYENGTAFFIDTGYPHHVTNNSEKDRIHLIIHGRFIYNNKFMELM